MSKYITFVVVCVFSCLEAQIFCRFSIKGEVSQNPDKLFETRANEVGEDS